MTAASAISAAMSGSSLSAAAIILCTSATVGAVTGFEASLAGLASVAGLDVR